MDAEDISDAVRAIRAEVVNQVVTEHVPAESPEEMWDKDGLGKALDREFGVRFDAAKVLEQDHTLDEKALHARVVAEAEQEYEKKTAEIGPKLMHHIEKEIMLRQLDLHWKEHIGALDYLRQGIHLRGYAQRNPKQEYKREAFEMFSGMLERVKHDTISILSKIQIRRPEDVQAIEPETPDPRTLRFQHAAAPSLVAPPPPSEPVAPQLGARALAGARLPQRAEAEEPVAPYVREQPKVGRNAPCPCGSGKKFKQCHGRLS
jgi:preprotein translocase subunit SecA